MGILLEYKTYLTHEEWGKPSQYRVYAKRWTTGLFPEGTGICPLATRRAQILNYPNSYKLSAGIKATGA